MLLSNETLIPFVSRILKMLPETCQIICSSATINKSDLESLGSLRVGNSTSTEEDQPKTKFVTVSNHKAVEKAKSVTLRYCFMP